MKRPLEAVVSVSPVSYEAFDPEAVAPATLVPHQTSLSLWGSLSGALKCWYYGTNPCVLTE